jgi:predicted nucleic acid-binding protein
MSTKIILDSNILFSAMIKDSFTRKMILEFEGFFLFPSFIFEEIKKNKKELLMKSKMKKKEFDLLLELLLQKVIIIEKEILNKYKKEAFEIIKEIDPNDAVFISCALAYPESIIWSDDKKLKKQTKIKVLNTSEIYSYFEDQRKKK